MQGTRNQTRLQQQSRETLGLQSTDQRRAQTARSRLDAHSQDRPMQDEAENKARAGRGTSQDAVAAAAQNADKQNQEMGRQAAN